jgi:hypothetical protein
VNRGSDVPKAHNTFSFYFNQLQNQIGRIVSQESAVGFYSMSRKPAVLLLSRPSSHENHLNRQKTKEKKLPCKWHSSYVPPDKIEGVEKNKGNPGSAPGFFMPETETRRKLFIFLLIAISILESNLCMRKLTSRWFHRL